MSALGKKKSDESAYYRQTIPSRCARVFALVEMCYLPKTSRRVPLLSEYNLHASVMFYVLYYSYAKMYMHAPANLAKL